MAAVSLRSEILIDLKMAAVNLRSEVVRYFRDAVNLRTKSEIESRLFDLLTDAVNLLGFRLALINLGVYLESPCLIFSQSSGNLWKVFHSIYNGFCVFDFPELEGAEIHFSKDGWLLMSGDQRPPFFFNPCTRAKFVLPPAPCSFISVCFTSPPSSSVCCVFGLLCDSTAYDFHYGFIEFGDDEWKLGRWEIRQYIWISNCPPIFVNGVYYFLDSGGTSIIEFNPAKENENDEFPWKQNFLVNINRDEYNEEDDEEEAEVEGDDEEEDDNEDEEVEGDDEEEDDDEDDEEEEEEEEDIVHEMYMVEVEGDIWAVFLKNKIGNVRVKKLDLSEMQWRKLDSLGGYCLYVSNKGSFAEPCLGSDMADKIYFDRFYGKNGVMYCMKSRMYHSVGGDFASREVAGNTVGNNIYGPGLSQPYNATWFKPRRN